MLISIVVAISAIGILSLVGYAKFSHGVLINHSLGLSSSPQQYSLTENGFLSSNQYSKTLLYKQGTFSNKTKRILLLTAHPDDEAMFFSPSILGILKQLKTQLKTQKVTETARDISSDNPEFEIYLLCLSKGRNCQDTRIHELRKAGPILGIPVDKIYVDDLNDGEQWSNDEVSSRLEKKLKQWEIDILITFDDYGVSGHLNHISCYHGAQHYMKSIHPSKRIPAFVLKSQSIFKKYLAWLGFPHAISNFKAQMSKCNNLLFTNPSPDHTHQSMLAHISQYVWFRRIYIKLSQYVFWNELEPLHT